MWPQTYTPAGGLALSAALAALPIVVLLGLLAFGHARAHWAALAGLATALLVAMGVYAMPPAMALAAAGDGAAFGLFPIGWLLLNAIFVYELSVTTGQFESLKEQVAGVAADPRLQTLLIAYCFGAFIEGAAGFGAPVAISGALLIGLGFPPLQAAVLALIGNTAPVAFGSLGIPITTLAKVTGLDVNLLSAMIGRQLPPFSLLIPFWLIVVQSGWRGMLGVWPACLVAGGAFAATQFVVSNYHGPLLVDLASASIAMCALTILLRFWQPSDAIAVRQPASLPPESGTAAVKLATRSSRWRSWVPWAALTLAVFTWSLPPVKAKLARVSVDFRIAALDGKVQRMPPVSPVPKREEAVWKFDWLGATGTALFLSSLVTAITLRVKPAHFARLYGRTLWRLRVSLLTIGAMLALGYTTRFSGLDSTIGLAFAHTGLLFPFFSPLLGWLGVALTGSDTASNVLFGNLQQVTAAQLKLPPVLMAAANSSGGVMGKMIDAQSIVVASVATAKGAEHAPAGLILRRVFWHSLTLAALVGLWILGQAYLFPSIVPR